MGSAPSIDLAVQHSLAAKEAPSPRIARRHYREKARLIACAVRESGGTAAVGDLTLLARGVVGVVVDGHGLHVPLDDLPPDVRRWATAEIGRVSREAQGTDPVDRVRSG